MKHLLQESSNYDEYHDPALPDKNKPWCPSCRLHTEWYSVYNTSNTGGTSTRSLACEGCDGLIYCPAGPTKRNIIGVALVGPFLVLGAGLITISFDLAGALADEEKLIFGLGSIAVGIFMAYTLRNVHKKVRKHWEEFHKWAEELGHR